MISEKLQKARDFEDKYLPFVPEKERPGFHVTGAIGWINDPNGFSMYKGEYHLFFQYHPYSTVWGPMHWGHVKTKDFIKWERLPVAMAPDQDYDKDGCFSGSAIELDDGRQLLIYTGVHRGRFEDGRVKELQTQCVAIGDGINYEKYPLNPVLTAEDLPEGGSPVDFRDPKIWKEGDTYYIVVGNRPADGSGSILMYESKNGLDWTFDGKVAACHNQFGLMWECPDFFELDGKYVLLTSPQEMTTIGLEFHAGNATLCLIGQYEREIHHLKREYVQAIDYGTDFYAPQTLLTPDGRRVMIAWMQNWETSNSQPRDIHYFGEMTLPRELRVRNGRLFQNPVREIENYRNIEVLYTNMMISSETVLKGVSGRCIDMTVSIRPVNPNKLYNWFKIHIAKSGEVETIIRFKPENYTVRVDRSRCGFPHDIVNVRDFSVRSENGEIKMRIVLDKHSLELFVNDGEQAASFVIYSPAEADSISFECDGHAFIDIKKYDLVFD